MSPVILQKSFAEKIDFLSQPEFRDGSIIFEGSLFSLYSDSKGLQQLSTPQLDTLKLCNGQQSIASIAEQIRVGESEVLRIVQDFEEKTPGIFNYPKDVLYQQHLAHARSASALFARHLGETRLNSAPSLLNYHQQGMSGDAFSQFEHFETTVSHMFREPLAALSGKTYGAALADKLIPLLGAREEIKVLEVGAGTGYLAREFLRNLAQRDLLHKVEYQIVDLSPNLQESQRRELLEFDCLNFRDGDVLSLDFEINSIDLLVNNEVIADFAVAKVGPDSGNQAKDLEAKALALKYELPLEDRVQLLNIGAISFIEQIAKFLAPGGWAFISEYGDYSLPPRQVALSGHNEHSIRFDHLEQVAIKNGLETELLNLLEYLPFCQNSQVLSNLSMSALNQRLLPRQGVQSVPRLALTRDELGGYLGKLEEKIFNLHFSPLSETNYNLSPALFFVLQLSKA